MKAVGCEIKECMKIKKKKLKMQILKNKDFFNYEDLTGKNKKKVGS